MAARAHPFAVALAGLALLAGCARSAGPLPSDTGSVGATAPVVADFSPADQALTCAEIAEQRAALEDRSRKAEAVIAGDRAQNQVAGYLAALFLVPIVAVDTNQEQVALLDQNQRRQDMLRELQRAKSC